MKYGIPRTLEHFDKLVKKYFHSIKNAVKYCCLWDLTHKLPTVAETLRGYLEKILFNFVHFWPLAKSNIPSTIIHLICMRSDVVKHRRLQSRAKNMGKFAKVKKKLSPQAKH